MSDDLVAPHIHEYSGNHIYTDHGVKPYWALGKLVWTHFGGNYQGEVVVDGETWDVHLYPQDSGIAPRESDDVDHLYEYRLLAQGEGRRNLSVLFQPRFAADEMRTTEGKPISVPKNLGEAVNVRFQNSANIDLEEYSPLVPQLLQAIARAEDVYWNFEYFTGDPHHYSNITALEVYVRVHREQAKKIIRRSGLFHRLYELVAAEKGSKVVYYSDNTGKNTDIVGYNHQVRMNMQGAEALLPGGQRAKQFKHYHPEYVRTENDDDPLYHPKFGVLFKKKWADGGAVPWADRYDLREELEENLINALSWAGLPIDAGPTYVADDHFGNRASERDVALYDDPTPAIEARQDALLVRTVADLQGSELETLEQLITDGGKATTHELADGTGKSLSTIYRALDAIGALVENSNGHVSIISKKLDQDLREILDRHEHQAKVRANALARMLHMDPHQVAKKGSAWQKWLTKYAAQTIEDGDRLTLKIQAMMDRLKSTGCPRLAEVLDEGLRAYDQAGGDPRDFRTARVQWTQPSGDRGAGIVGALLR